VNKTPLLLSTIRRNRYVLKLYVVFFSHILTGHERSYLHLIIRCVAHPDDSDFDPITKHRTGPVGVYLPDQNGRRIIAGSMKLRRSGSFL